MTKIACVQSNVVFNDPAANTALAIVRMKELRAQDVELVVFPEAYLTGYCVDSAESAGNIAIDAHSKYIGHLSQACEELEMIAVVGFAESVTHQDPATGHRTILFNTAALFEPGREVRFYRKAHLPELGLDKFVCQGHGPLEVFDTRIGKIGILICFDLRPPEATRVLALNGAQILILPTNWPEGAERNADHTPITRAMENRIFVATCDRVGEENGFKFIGRSKIVDPSGKVLASAGDQEEVIFAELDLDFANQKRVVTVPGKFEIEVFKARRPDLYSDLTRDP
jgi:predicted amidohydrolase